MDWADLARHGTAIATVRVFAETSGAQRVAVLLDAGAGEGIVLECEPGRPLEVTSEDGERFVLPPEATDSVAALPVEIPLAAPATAIEVDPDADRVLAPVGVVPALADGVLALARALGGRTVATAEFATRDPARPLTIAGREGEGVVLAIGDQQFEL
jgi:hypothetical protein